MFLRYQFMRLRRIKFHIVWEGDRYVPDITNFILDYATEKNLILLRVRVKKHIDGKSRIWLWVYSISKDEICKGVI